MQTKTRKKKEDRIRSAFMKSLQKKKRTKKKTPTQPQNNERYSYETDKSLK